ncbi:MAG: hypothetical protein QOK43_1954 [Acidimicrobiaceae bacterium]|nr:hypothetical protein [Acidimicrobiaceae bacterium]
MRADHWRSITAIAEAQAGLVTSAQLRLAGASPSAVNRLVHERQLLPVRKGVLAVAGAPVDKARPIRAAALAAPRAVVSHRSAAWLHGLLARPPHLVELTAAEGIRPRLHGAVSCEGPLGPDEVSQCEGIPVTSVPRTLIDLTSVLMPDWVERLVHESIMRRLCEYADVRRAAEHAAANDVNGAIAMLGLVGEAEGTTPLEAMWHKILRQAGLPPAVTQHQVAVGSRLFVLDFAWPDARVALEVNGFAPHRTRAAFDRDHEKVATLQAAGWQVVSASARTPRDTVLSALRRHLSRFSTAPVAVEKLEGVSGGRR